MTATQAERYNWRFASVRCQYRKSRTDDRRDDPAANVMRDIPEGAYASALPTREPVCNGNKRGADAHALKKAIEDHQSGKYPECATESQPNVNNRAEYQTARHEDFWAGFIRQTAHYAFTDSVSNKHTATQQADLRSAEINCSFK